MDVLVQLVVWLNAAANTLGGWLLAPIAYLPGWLSATLVAAATGVLLLVCFKYTSNQRAIKRVRDDINANLLALKLFKDHTRVVLQAQRRLFVGAGELLFMALVPMAAMVVPVILILGQLSLWYQQRPLRVGEEAVVTLKLNGDTFPAVSLQPTDAAQATVGPVRVFSKHEVCWNIRALQSGYHHLAFEVDGQRIDKELAVGTGFQRVSAQRPGWSWQDVLMHPWEKPFAPGSPVRSIAIDYPKRLSWTSGADWWVVYWFIVSMVAALCFRGVLNVNV